jgi:DNA-directed RNA polymerase subunit RPC12/RpoP
VDYPGEHWERLLSEARKVARDELPDDIDEETLDQRTQWGARRQWVLERWGEYFPCSNCGNTEWWISDQGMIGPQVSAYPITCRYCGHTVLVSPELADLDEPSHETGEQ